MASRSGVPTIAREYARKARGPRRKIQVSGNESAVPENGQARHHTIISGVGSRSIRVSDVESALPGDGQSRHHAFVSRASSRP